MQVSLLAKLGLEFLESDRKLIIGIIKDVAAWEKNISHWGHWHSTHLGGDVNWSKIRTYINHIAVHK